MNFPALVKERRTLRYILLGISILSFLLLGAFRYSYVINLFVKGYPWIIERKELTKEVIAALKEKNSDPRWLSSFLYTCFFAILATCTTYLIFLNAKFSRITLGVYIFLATVAAILLAGALLLDSPKLLYFSERVRDILQEPFLLFFLTAVFFLWSRSYRMDKNASPF